VRISNSVKGWAGRECALKYFQWTRSALELVEVSYDTFNRIIKREKQNVSSQIRTSPIPALISLKNSPYSNASKITNRNQSPTLPTRTHARSKRKNQNEDPAAQAHPGQSTTISTPKPINPAVCRGRGIDTGPVLTSSTRARFR
jgi:hypothetical protein